jgi:hypothetical protein
LFASKLTIGGNLDSQAIFSLGNVGNDARCVALHSKGRYYWLSDEPTQCRRHCPANAIKAVASIYDAQNFNASESFNQTNYYSYLLFFGKIKSEQFNLTFNASPERWQPFLQVVMASLRARKHSIDHCILRVHIGSVKRRQLVLASLEALLHAALHLLYTLLDNGHSALMRNFASVQTCTCLRGSLFCIDALDRALKPPPQDHIDHLLLYRLGARLESLLYLL